MTDKRLVPYGSADHAVNVAKVGKTKTPHSLVARMPSAELAAKVGPPSSAPTASPLPNERRVERLHTGS